MRATPFVICSLALLGSGCNASAPGGASTPTPPRAPPGRTFGPVVLAEYCEQRAVAECHRLEACSPRRLVSEHGGSAQCLLERAGDCERSFLEVTTDEVVQMGLIQIDPTRLGEALGAFTRRPCGSLVGAPTPLSGAIGQRSLGEPCGADEVCASGACERRGACGACVEAPETPPSSCPVSCPLGEVCRCTTSDAGRSCGCVLGLREGEDCASARTSCSEGLVCLDYRDPMGARFTRCTAMPAEGERCGSRVGFTECSGDAFCDAADTGLGFCRPPEVVRAGEGCDDRTRLCPYRHDCRGVCVPRADRGEACVPPNPVNVPDGGPPTCTGGGCNGTCTEPLGEGNVCFEVWECQPELGCTRSPLARIGICESEATVRQRTRSALDCR